MSNSRLIQWFEQLLFGSSDPILSPPDKLQNIILRLEAENISWNHIISEGGGLTAFPYQVHGDLNFLIDYLEKQWIDKQPYQDPPNFKTRVVSKFWDQIRLLLARRIETQSSLPVPSKRDDEILKELLESPRQQDYKFESAEFWGKVARRFIDSKRPTEPSTLPNLDSQLSNRAKLLYEITCRIRGRYFDPLSMHLVPEYEYLNAAHWQTSRNLEAFMINKPTHPLTLSVQNLLHKSIIQLLDGKKPSALTTLHLDSFLHNINVIHASIEQVPQENEPPKLIDIFQRLLALSQRDGLWEKQVPSIEPEPISPSLLHLTEQIQFLEREKRILLGKIA